MNGRLSAASVSFALVAVASACSGRDAGAETRSPSTPSPSPLVAVVDARERLFALGRAWLRTPAEVTYATVAPIKGQAMSTHQCLRAMVETRLDLVESLRNCSRQGRLILEWDPPGRWRMKVVTPLDRFDMSSRPGRSEVCRRMAADLLTCRSLSETAAIRSSGFGFLFEPPERILDAIGATEVMPTEPGEQFAVASVECFASTGPDVHVEWCYSPDGVLLSFLRGSGSLGWTSLEATTDS